MIGIMLMIGLYPKKKERKNRMPRSITILYSLKLIILMKKIQSKDKKGRKRMEGARNGNKARMSA